MYEFPFGAGQQLNLNWIINEIITLHHLLDPDWELPNFDNAFPYTNLNQLNLDWILRELKAIKDLAPSEDAQLLKMVANALIANTYDAETQYNVDDIVYRDDDHRLYKCIIATPAGGEPFDSSKWAEVDVGGVLSDLLNSVKPYNGTPAMDGTASAGTSTQFARGDHVHPKDTARVPTSRTVNGKALSDNITLNASDIPNDSNITGDNVDDALDNLNGALASINFANATAISTANEDLNNYTNGGVWYFPSTYAPLNKPEISGGGFLVVMRGGANSRLTQIWINNNTTYVGGYWRTNSSSSVSWSEWHEIAIDNTTITRGTVKKNSQNLTAEFLAVAETYYTNRQYLQYGNNTFLDTEVVNNKIDCSALVGLCMRGLPFDETPLSPSWTEGAKSPLYWAANQKYSWSWNPYNYTVLSGATSYNNLCRKASQFAKLMLEQGQRVVVDEKFANIEAGDIIFYSKKNDGEWVEPNKFMHVSHVAICVEKADTEIDSYPFTHTILEAAGRQTNGIGKFTLETDTNTEFISLVCRPDLGALVGKLQEIPVTIADPLPTGVTAVNGLSVYRKDDIVQVLLSITRDSTAMNTFSIVASGFPIPAIEGMIGSISIPFAEINPRSADATGVTLRVRVDQNGRLRIAKGTIADDYNGGFLYLAKN